MLSSKNLQEFVEKTGVKAEIISFPQPVRNVSEAARAAGVSENQFVKSVVLFKGERAIIAIVNGRNRVDLRKVGAALGFGDIRIAAPEKVPSLTDYPAGGVPPIGVKNVIVLIDEKVAVMPALLAGGGDDRHLLKTSGAEIVRVTGGKVADVRKTADSQLI